MTPPDQERAQRIAGELTELERRILSCMSDGECVYPMRDTASDAGVPYGTTRKILRTFHKEGIANFGTLHNLIGNGRRVGSGYWRTPFGEQVLKHL